MVEFMSHHDQDHNSIDPKASNNNHTQQQQQQQQQQHKRELRLGFMMDQGPPSTPTTPMHDAKFNAFNGLSPTELEAKIANSPFANDAKIPGQCLHCGQVFATAKSCVHHAKRHLRTIKDWKSRQLEIAVINAGLVRLHFSNPLLTGNDDSNGPSSSSSNLLAFTKLMKTAHDAIMKAAADSGADEDDIRRWRVDEALSIVSSPSNLDMIMERLVSCSYADISRLDAFQRHQELFRICHCTVALCQSGEFDPDDVALKAFLQRMGTLLNDESRFQRFMNAIKNHYRGDLSAGDLGDIQESCHDVDDDDDEHELAGILRGSNSTIQPSCFQIVDSDDDDDDDEVQDDGRDGNNDVAKGTLDFRATAGEADRNDFIDLGRPSMYDHARAQGMSPEEIDEEFNVMMHEIFGCCQNAFMSASTSMLDRAHILIRHFARQLSGFHYFDLWQTKLNQAVNERAADRSIKAAQQAAASKRKHEMYLSAESLGFWSLGNSSRDNKKHATGNNNSNNNNNDNNL